MLSLIHTMTHSPIKNYAIPGLTSWLVGERHADGSCTRLFTCERNHVEPIIPHSHRFNFECIVLEGEVTNRVWTQSEGEFADKYRTSVLGYNGQPGQYTIETAGINLWEFTDATYIAGDTYSMQADEVHSIYFSKGAKVLFFEGPTISHTSVILQPVVDGQTIPTFKVEDWMFLRGE